MKKEVLLAIIIGFALGLVIVFGVWTANKALKQPPTTSTETPEELAVTPEITSIPEGAISLKITSPENNTISEKEKINLAGQTVATATIAILYDKGEKLLNADDDGAFTTEITLNAGSNEITVTAFDKDGNEATQKLIVVYSTAEI